MRLKFSVTHDLAAGNGLARSGLIETAHGKIETPIFMPVGTAGTVKGLLPEQLKAAGAQIILGNTYHLMLRPGAETLRAVGGLRKWMNWQGPLLTDSGGFQVFSLAKLRKISNEGVAFKSHLDGSDLFMSPESSIDMQEAIASTIMMVLDVCPALPATRESLIEACQTSTDWATRCLAARRDDSGSLFAIVQGGLDVNLRLDHMNALLAIEDGQRHFDGLALGGFSVGEDPVEMAQALINIAHKMPEDRPRYLMGVGTPQDLLRAIGSGIDMFDCVMPTRNARNGTIFTSEGLLHIRNAPFIQDTRPLDPHCSCYTCQNFSRSYLRHLHNSGEILASVLSSLHNVHFYLDLMTRARAAISQNAFLDFARSELARWRLPEVMLFTNP
jgi:queuine tRNA-ribosyltransferase